jgi:hypothetical protein
MKKILIILFCFITVYMAIACESEVEVTDESEQAEETEEIEITPFSQDDFVLKIDTLPYRGAVLFIEYLGDIDISEYELRIEIRHAEKMTQNDIVEEVDGNLISEIVDFMYLPGDELNFTLKIKKEDNQIYEHNYSEQLKRYPWKDWMLIGDEWLLLPSDYNHDHDNFIYGKPSWGGVGAHASWDILTKPNVPVYSGTIGVVVLEYLAISDTSIHIFNPYVGAILQYGHVTPSKELYPGKIVTPGEHIANVCPKDLHIHYSTIRPYKLGWDRTKKTYWFTFEIVMEGNLFDLKYYQDPFYFHPEFPSFYTYAGASTPSNW